MPEVCGNCPGMKYNIQHYSIFIASCNRFPKTVIFTFKSESRKSGTSVSDQTKAVYCLEDDPDERNYFICILLKWKTDNAQLFDTMLLKAGEAPCLEPNETTV